MFQQHNRDYPFARSQLVVNHTWWEDIRLLICKMGMITVPVLSCDED